MPKEHILLIRYPTHHLSLNHYKKKFPTYEYIISLKYEAKQIRIGRPDKLTNQEDPDITYTYGQAGCSVHDFIIKKNIGVELEGSHPCEARASCTDPGQPFLLIQSPDKSTIDRFIIPFF